MTCLSWPPPFPTPPPSLTPRHCGWVSQDSMNCNFFLFLKSPGQLCLQPYTSPESHSQQEAPETWALCQPWAQFCFWNDPQAVEVVLTVVGQNCLPPNPSLPNPWSLLKFHSSPMSNPVPFHNHLSRPSPSIYPGHCDRVSQNTLGYHCSLFSTPPGTSVCIRRPSLKMVPSHGSLGYIWRMKSCLVWCWPVTVGRSLSFTEVCWRSHFCPTAWSDSVSWRHRRFTSWWRLQLPSLPPRGAMSR
jgi:hypothetical protein